MSQVRPENRLFFLALAASVPLLLTSLVLLRLNAPFAIVVLPLGLSAFGIVAAMVGEARRFVRQLSERPREERRHTMLALGVFLVVVFGTWFSLMALR